jgi:hypothetical protein
MMIFTAVIAMSLKRAAKGPAAASLADSLLHQIKPETSPVYHRAFSSFDHFDRNYGRLNEVTDGARDYR